MFPEGTPDMQALLAQAAAMQEQLVATQEAMAVARVDGTSGGGLVVATVSGTGDLVSLLIDPAACDPDDTDTLADLVVAAVRDATTNAHQLAAVQFGDLPGGLGGDAPDLGQGGPAGFLGPRD
ncbi:MAG: YbaB/EbfC family nucleoid-associated protein [Propionibacteriales bacterium]|nr:YbaB/EbfC family nucleoid-associated protein [Propionibacteriales bacterium]